MFKFLINNIYWDKSKRKLVISPKSLLLALLVTAGFLITFKLVEFTNYLPLLDYSVSFVNPNDIIVNLVPLRKKLDSIVQDIGSDHISLYLESLNSGANITINKDLRVFPFSLAKLPLAIVVMKKIENRELKLNQGIELKEEDLDSLSGELYKSKAGTVISIGDLLKTLLVDSDNTAQHALLRNISLDNMQVLISGVGLEGLSNSDSKISAKEYTRFFRILFFSSYLLPKNSQRIIELLSEATFHDFISSGMPPNVTFAHKYGEDINNQIYLDSGIIYIKNRPTMITVMLQGLKEVKAKEVMSDIGYEAYRYVSNYNP